MAEILRGNVDFTYLVGANDPDVEDVDWVRDKVTVHAPDAFPAPNHNDFHIRNMRYIEQTAQEEGEFSNWYIQAEGQGQELSEAIEEAEQRTELGIETPSGSRIPESQISNYLDSY